VPLLALGASDCEALRDGWLGQPVNTLSSLAYVAAGAYLLRRDASSTPLLALALAGVGVGSVLYHGPMPRGAEPLHDGSIVALVAAVGLAWRHHSFRWPPAAALTAAGAAVVANVLTRSGAPLCRPDSLLQGHAAWHVLTATAIAVWFSPREQARTTQSGGSAEPAKPGQPSVAEDQPARHSWSLDRLRHRHLPPSR
jgi:hypothetical protein